MAWDDDYGEAQQGDLSNDRAGQAQYNAYHDACRQHGTDSKQAREALGRALEAGWTFEGLGPSGNQKTRGSDRRSAGRKGDSGRRSYGVGETGGSPSSGPSRGNGKFF